MKTTVADDRNTVCFSVTALTNKQTKDNSQCHHQQSPQGRGEGIIIYYMKKTLRAEM